MFPIRDSKNSGKFPIINLFLIIFNIYVFVQELLAPSTQLFIEKYALVPTNISLFQFETLTPFITSMFLHAGFLHILSNLWFLFTDGWCIGCNCRSLRCIFKIFSKKQY